MQNIQNINKIYTYIKTTWGNLKISSLTTFVDLNIKSVGLGLYGLFVAKNHFIYEDKRSCRDSEACEGHILCFGLV